MLTDRQLSILKAIIQNYTDVGQPIGSKKLQEQLPIHVSSATIRNEMAALERQGFIMKQHSSSGRIPSLEGYRYYVDNLLEPDKLDRNAVSRIRKSLNNEFAKVDDIVALSAQLLSQMTNYVAISLKPGSNDVVVEGFRLVPLGNQQIMVLLVTSDGSVENQIFSIPENIHDDQLEAVIRLINEEVVGLPLSEVSEHLIKAIPQVSSYLRNSNDFIETFGDILDKAVREHMYVSGKHNVLDFVQDDDLEKVKSLYSLINRPTDLRELVKSNGEDVAVKINDDHDSALNYSLVSATYDDGNHGHGLIAILGPTNMHYSQVIGMLDTFRNELSKRLINYYRNFNE